MPFLQAAQCVHQLLPLPHAPVQVIVDGRGHLSGRLASVIAKELLLGACVTIMGDGVGSATCGERLHARARAASDLLFFLIPTPARRHSRCRRAHGGARCFWQHPPQQAEVGRGGEQEVQHEPYVSGGVQRGRAQPASRKFFVFLPLDPSPAPSHTPFFHIAGAAALGRTARRTRFSGRSCAVRCEARRNEN